MIRDKTFSHAISSLHLKQQLANWHIKVLVTSTSTCQSVHSNTRHTKVHYWCVQQLQYSLENDKSSSNDNNANNNSSSNNTNNNSKNNSKNNNININKNEYYYYFFYCLSAQLGL